MGCYTATALVALIRTHSADRLGAVLCVAGSALGIAVALQSVIWGVTLQLFSFAWQVPGGSLELVLDPLSGAFLLVIFLVAGLGSIYGLAYWRRSDHPETASGLRLFFCLMTVALAVVVTARNSVLFLVAWELMAVSAFFLVATEHENTEVRRAAWTYLIATHIGTVFLFASFLLLRMETGSFLITGGLQPGARMSLVFLLALVGFGFKAGLVPFHFWLPPAHGNAPSHVSALMSGVMLKAGIYGILRITSLVATPPAWWAFLLLLIAGVTAITGICLALTQTDLKKALAYSSIENMGVICLGIALALAGRSFAEPAWIVLGLAGAIAHVWSHAVFKSLLFFASGGVLHGVHTRSMERMGGLLKLMPVTGASFVVGALAASGLPFLNGFFSEWLIALGLFHALSGKTAAGAYLAFAAPALAFAGAVALASFVRIVSIVFLGTARSSAAESAHESPRLMLIPLAILSSICVVMGVAPGILIKPLSSVAASWAGARAALQFQLIALPPVSIVVCLLLLLCTAVALALLLRSRIRDGVTWDCGYARPSARMQYTASSAGEWFSGHLLPRSLRSAAELSGATGIFPEPAAFHSAPSDPFATRLYEPFVLRCKSWFERLRWVQQGRLTIYLIYILLMTVGGIAWAALREYLR